MNKHVWASVDDSMPDVVEETVQEALRRDAQHLRQWVVLVDGQNQQLVAVKAAAQSHCIWLANMCETISRTLWSTAP